MSEASTTSVCPECLRRLPATVVRVGDEVWLERACPEHGDARALVWRGPPDYDDWRRAGTGPSCCDPAENPECPNACGLCQGHARQTCCVLLEVTSRCDLGCPVCFAGASGAAPADPSIGTIEGWFRRLLEVAPGANVQLSGGEPTVRDDLPPIIARGRDLGLPFFQLNTNGLRIAREDGYAEQLAEAGLGTVFLQFDGTDDEPYVALRGRPLAAEKERAVDRCAAAGLGVVLVPTIARDVNLERLGDILEFALERMPVVRGIHLQPLALLGRYPEARAEATARVTLPEVMRELAGQSSGRIELGDLTPGDCEHALCSFSREYLRRESGELVPLGSSERASDGRADRSGEAQTCCGSGGAGEGAARGVSPSAKAAHVAKRWSAPGGSCCGSSSPAPDDQWSRILAGLESRTFSVSGMAFQDAWTLDLERLRHCYLHVLSADGRIVPFCAYNLTAAGGQGLPTGRVAQANGQ